MRAKAAQHLREWQREESITRLSPLINDISQYARTEALLTLAIMAPDRFTNEIIALSKSEDLYDRAMAALAFGNTKLDRVAPYLEKLCQDENEAVRDAAIAGLGNLGTPSAVQVLIRMLNSSDPAARKKTREALKILGKEPPPVR